MYPEHPKPATYTWTAEEREAIEAYGAARFESGRQAGQKEEPAGWRLVPEQPTAAMVNAPFAGVVEDQSLQGQRQRRARMADAYRAMIAEAPKP